MDNYFPECPAQMNDGRLYTDYRSSQVREKYFQYKNCLGSENEARTTRIQNGEQLLNDEWKYLVAAKMSVPRKVFFHTSPTTRTSNAYNFAEMNAYTAYNSEKIGEYKRSETDMRPPEYNINCKDLYRMTTTKEFDSRSKECEAPYFSGCGYPDSVCPQKCKNGTAAADGVRPSFE